MSKTQATIRELLAKCGKVLDNPFLRKIVDHAPSPVKADKYIKSLGWPNRLAEKVRNAVRLRNQFLTDDTKREDQKKAWNEFIATNVRPALALFSFTKSRELPQLQISHELKLDNWKRSIENWPFFMRDFAMVGKPSSSAFGVLFRDAGSIKPMLVTSVDGIGRSEICDALPYFNDKGIYSFKEHIIAHKWYKHFGAFIDGSPGFRFIKRKLKDDQVLNIKGRTITINPTTLFEYSSFAHDHDIQIMSYQNDYYFPGFYKIVQITKSDDDYLPLGGGFERIRICMQFGMKNCEKPDEVIGYVNYENSMDISPDVAAVCKLIYELHSDMSLHLEQSLRPFISIIPRYIRDTKDFYHINPSSLQMPKTMSKILDIIKHMLRSSTRKKLTLHDIAKARLLKNPPEHLFHLFVS